MTDDLFLMGFRKNASPEAEVTNYTKMKDSEFILGELVDFGVRITDEHAETLVINLENVNFKNLKTIVNLFNELEDCVR